MPLNIAFLSLELICYILWGPQETEGGEERIGI